MFCVNVDLRFFFIFLVKGFLIVIYNEDINFVYFLFMIYSLDFSDFFLMLDDDYYWFIRVYG